MVAEEGAGEDRSLTLLRGGNELRFEVPGVVGFRVRLIFNGSGSKCGSTISRRLIWRVANGGSGSSGGGPEAENNRLEDDRDFNSFWLTLGLSAVSGRTVVGVNVGVWYLGSGRADFTVGDTACWDLVTDSVSICRSGFDREGIWRSDDNDGRRSQFPIPSAASKSNDTLGDEFGGVSSSSS